MMQALFQTLADHAIARLHKDEQATLWFDGEDSDFVRFNKGRVRQPGTVRQRTLHLRLIRGAKNVGAEVSVGGDLPEDRARLDAVLARLREALAHLPDDPHLLWDPEAPSVVEVDDGAPIEADQIVDDVLASAGGSRPVDLVGILAAGPVAAGYASSTGTRSWYQKGSYTFDWCLYHQGDKAVKSTIAGTAWDRRLLASRMETARATLAALARPIKKLEPGAHRAYLTPAAAREVVELLSWNSFGLKNQRTRQSGLERLVAGEATLDPRLSLAENLAEGTSPGFQSDGFVRAPFTPLIAEGRFAGSLVSPRSAVEFGVPNNGASRDESPDAADMAGGDLPQADALSALGTGLYVSNLWYLNYSDRPAGRMTGMTRFATMWVEGGEVVAPTEVMRFDETVYRMLGSELEALTVERDFLMDTGTYGQRGVKSWRLPGILLRELAFTL